MGNDVYEKMTKENALSLLHSKLLEMVCDLDVFCREHNIDYVLAFGNVLGAVRHKGFIPWDDDLDVEMTRENYDKFLSEFKNTDKYYLQKENEDYPLQFSKLRANKTSFIEDIPYRKNYANIHQGVFIDIFPVDKVAKNTFNAKCQNIFAHIVTAQSLALRGYPKSHNSLKKRIIMCVALLLLPFRRLMINFVKSFNKNNDFDYYCSYYDSSQHILNTKTTFTPPFSKLSFENVLLPVVNDYKTYLEKTYGDYMKLPSEKEIEYAIHAKYFSLTDDYTSCINRYNI